MKTYRPFLIIVIVLAAAVLGGVLLLRSGRSTDSSESAEPLPTIVATPAKDLLLKPWLPSRSLGIISVHRAVQAAEAARMQDRFWQMHDLLYENQKLWSNDVNPKIIFVGFARDLGLDTERFVRNLEDQEVKRRIDAGREAGDKLGINGTPTILINGRRLRDQATTPDGIRKGIERLMGPPQSPAH